MESPMKDRTGYTVGRLARRYGLSRTALLYYDRIGLLRPSGRTPGGYRQYSQADAARLGQIMAYRRAGLGLGAIVRVLEAPESRLARTLEARLDELSQEIQALRQQQRLILGLLGAGRLPEDGMLDKAAWVDLLAASGFSEDDMLVWHREFERRAPQKHLRFLQALCIPKNEIEMIRAYAAGPEHVKDISERE